MAEQPSLFDDTPPAPPPPPPVPAVEPANFPDSWRAAIGKEFAEPYFAQLRAFVTEERKAAQVLPAAADVFNAFRFTPLDQVRVVILGQDPYPTPGHAHGLCFSVRPGVRLPGSLRNIYQELKDDLDIPPREPRLPRSVGEAGNPDAERGVDGAGRVAEQPQR